MGRCFRNSGTGSGLKNCDPDMSCGSIPEPAVDSDEVDGVVGGLDEAEILLVVMWK